MESSKTRSKLIERTQEYTQNFGKAIKKIFHKNVQI